jgi:hypothetical protein
MKLSERKEVLEKSGLCLFCLKHAAERSWSAMGEEASPSLDVRKPAAMGSIPLVYTS